MFNSDKGVIAAKMSVNLMNKFGNDIIIIIRTHKPENQLYYNCQNSQMTIVNMNNNEENCCYE